METSYVIFMKVAETQNMSQVAKDVHISHQCVSSHIKILEGKLGVKLFRRRPKLTLTREGEALLNAVHQIYNIEERIFEELKETNARFHGRIKIGIPLSRYNILVPLLLPEFKRIYPNVQVEIQSDFSNILEGKTINGELDLFIGMGNIDSVYLSKISLFEESFYLMISDNLLKEYFFHDYPSCIEKFKKGIQLKDFKNLPFIITPHPSRLRKTVEMMADQNDFKLNIALESNHLDTYGLLCKQDLGVSIISDMFSKSIASINGKESASNPLRLFPFKNFFEYCREVSIAYYKHSFIPAYQFEFIDMTKKILCTYQSECRDYLINEIKQ
jgi:DNA-binding transcriptional LysR family regulator